MDSWDTGTTREGSVDIGFSFQEGGIDRHMLEFDGNFVASVDVGSLCAVSLKKQLGRLHLLPMYTAPKLPPPILL